jgi:ferritin-like metal-binding protein YciE
METLMAERALELYVVGLKNAHAMEREAEEMLKRGIQRLSDYPDLASRMREHLAETKEQLKRLEKLLEQQADASSLIKDTALAAGANMAAMAHTMADDEVLKNSFANNALEAFEIAAYKSLIAMAEEAGVHVKTVLSESLREEERMAAWLDQNIEKVTLEYLRKEEKRAAA